LPPVNGDNPRDKRENTATHVSSNGTANNI
jgi:hypothetical protein